MTLEEEVAVLRAENARLREDLAVAPALIEQLRGDLTPALARLEELTAQAQHTRPAFVRANKTPAEGAEKKGRKKRAAAHNKGRPREEPPTRIVQHALERCPDCGYALRGQSIDWTRQWLEAPPPPPVEVVEPQYLKRNCPACDRWHTPKADADEVVGQGRLGIRLLRPSYTPQT